jgi:hypothetical protein
VAALLDGGQVQVLEDTAGRPPEAVPTEDVGGPTLTISCVPKRAFLWLTTIALVIVAGNILGIVSFYYLGHSRLSILDVDMDGNIPTYFSSITLLLCAVLLAIIFVGRRKGGRRDKAYWAGLALVFGLLSVDEASGLHERVAEPLRAALHISGSAYAYLWLLPYAVFLLVLLILYIPFFLSLAPRMKRLIVLSVIVYVSGAVGFEFIGSCWAQHVGMNDPGYDLITTAEWLLQIEGVLILAFALMSYIALDLANLRLRIGSPEHEPPSQETF